MTNFKELMFDMVPLILAACASFLGVIVTIVSCVCCYKQFEFEQFKETEEYEDSPPGIYTAMENEVSDGMNLRSPVSNGTHTVDEVVADVRQMLPVLPNECTLHPRISKSGGESSNPERINVSNKQFPRASIEFIKEIGSGWFGRVIQGDAQRIVYGLKRSKVAIKMLEMTATKEDQYRFMLDNLPYRELDHTNVMKMLGACTETHPYLIILEYFPLGDLKHFLLKRQNEVTSFNIRGTLLRFACDIAAGLHCLHEHSFIHHDFAIRNCMVANDMSVKIGDYGITEETYKEDYYFSLGNPIPLRWCAPETVRSSYGQISMEKIDKAANIWSLGVSLWELLSLGKLPYHGTSDQVLLDKILKKEKYKLDPLTGNIKLKDKLYEVMLLCWLKSDDRKSAIEIYNLLKQLKDHHEAENEDEFNKRWETMMPKPPPPAITRVLNTQSAAAGERNSLLPDSTSQAMSSNIQKELKTKPAMVMPACSEIEDGIQREKAASFTSSLELQIQPALSPRSPSPVMMVTEHGLKPLPVSPDVKNAADSHETGYLNASDSKTKRLSETKKPIPAPRGGINPNKNSASKAQLSEGIVNVDSVEETFASDRTEILVHAPPKPTLQKESSTTINPKNLPSSQEKTIVLSVSTSLSGEKQASSTPPATTDTIDAPSSIIPDSNENGSKRKVGIGNASIKFHDWEDDDLSIGSPQTPPNESFVEHHHHHHHHSHKQLHPVEAHEARTSFGERFPDKVLQNFEVDVDIDPTVGAVSDLSVHETYPSPETSLHETDHEDDGNFFRREYTVVIDGEGKPVRKRSSFRSPATIRKLKVVSFDQLDTPDVFSYPKDSSSSSSSSTESNDDDDDDDDDKDNSNFAIGYESHEDTRKGAKFENKIGSRQAVLLNMGSSTESEDGNEKRSEL